MAGSYKEEGEKAGVTGEGLYGMRKAKKKLRHGTSRMCSAQYVQGKKRATECNIDDMCVWSSSDGWSG